MGSFGGKKIGIALFLALLLGFEASYARALVFTEEAKGVNWENALLTARLLYQDGGTSVRFQYRRVGVDNWTATSWDNCRESFYHRLLTGLDNNTSYEFRAQENYGGQIFTGESRTFRTLPRKPHAVTLRATLVDNTSALLRASIYYGPQDNVSIRFWYQPQGGSWMATPLRTGYRATYFENRLPGLSANTLYFFRAEITYGGTSENANIENFTTFSSSRRGMAYDGSLGQGSSPSGWHGVRVENLPSTARGLRLELLTSSPLPRWYPVRVVRDNGELLYSGNFLSDNGSTKVVSLRFHRSPVAGENVHLELYDPWGFAFKNGGSRSPLPLSSDNVRYAYSYLDRTGKNLRYYDRTCGVNLLEVYT